MSKVTVYDGRRLLGHVTERDGGKRCEAYGADGQALGVFQSPAKAVRAVYEADRERQRGVAA